MACCFMDDLAGPSGRRDILSRHWANSESNFLIFTSIESTRSSSYQKQLKSAMD